MKKALTEYAVGNDETEFPAKNIEQLIGHIDLAIDEANDGIHKMLSFNKLSRIDVITK